MCAWLVGGPRGAKIVPFCSGPPPRLRMQLPDAEQVSLPGPKHRGCGAGLVTERNGGPPGPESEAVGARTLSAMAVAEPSRAIEGFRCPEPAAQTPSPWAAELAPFA